MAEGEERTGEGQSVGGNDAGMLSTKQKEKQCVTGRQRSGMNASKRDARKQNARKDADYDEVEGEGAEGDEIGR